MPTELPGSSVERVSSSPEHADASVSPSLNAQNPWPGLAAYDEASRDFFNGRDEEAIELPRLIRLAPLTVLYGKSGLGKSSLLQAGLFPLLRADHYLPVNIDCSQGSDLTLERVAKRLMAELRRTKGDFIALGDESLWEYLHRKDFEIWTTDNFPLTPVLVFDQFEELFLRNDGNSKRIERFLDGLGDLIENRIPVELRSDAAKPKRSKLDLLTQRYRIVLSFREDFLPQVRVWEKKVPSLLRNYLRLEPMLRERAIAAVERSGAEVLDKGVAPVIVDFVGKGDEGANRSGAADPVIEPVLLSLCCYQLNRQRDGKRIDKALVDRAGRDILDSFYREALDDEEVKGPPDVSRFIEGYLIQGDRDRGNYSKEGALNDGLLTGRQLAALTDRHRLLRVVSHADTARIELIHDRLVPVVRKARDERQARELQAEQERKAEQAQAELKKERAQRKRAQHSLAIASAAALLFLVSLIMLLREKVTSQNLLSQVQITKMAEEAALHAKGEIALPADAPAELAPAELMAYRGLAAYRHLIKSTMSWQVNSGLRALHSALEASTHLRKVVRLRDAAAGPMASLTATPALAYSPDGHTLAVGGSDGSIHLLDAANYQEKLPLNCSSPPGTRPWSIAFNRNGTHLAASFNAIRKEARGLICIFDLVDGSIVRKWDVADIEGTSNDIGSISSLDFSEANGKEIVVAGGSENIVFVGDIESGHLGSLPKWGAGSISAISVSKTGRIAAAQGKIITVWDLGATNEKPVELTGHKDKVQALVFSPVDNSVLVSGGEDGLVKVWNVGEGCETQSAEIPIRIYALDINGQGEMVAAGGGLAKVRLYRLDRHLSCTSRAVDREIPKLELVKDVGELEAGIVLAVAFDRRGHRLASMTTDRTKTWEGTIRIWGLNTNDFSLAQLQSRADDGLPTALPANVTTVAISPEGMSIAAGDEKGNIHLWTRREYAEAEVQPATAEWTAHPNAIRSLAYIRIGNRLALVSGGEDGVLKSWDAESGRMILEMADGAKPVRAIAVSRDGTMLAAGSMDGTVRIWNLTTHAPPRRIRPNNWDWDPDDELYAVGFSPDAKYLVIGSFYLRLIPLGGADEGPGEMLFGHFDIKSLKSTPQLHTGDGGRVLSASEDGTVLAWDLERVGKRESTPFALPDQSEFRMKTRDGKGLTALDANADGRLVLTGGEQGQVQLWDAVYRQLIGPRFVAHDGDIKAVALAADGSFFVTADARKVLLWPGPNRWADIICQKLSWNMSAGQWKGWISASLEYKDQCENLPRLKD
jgi:WD40 repeat protein